METTNETTIGDRFADLLYDLKKRMLLRNDEEITESLKYSGPQILTSIKKNRSKPSDRLLKYLEDTYKVNRKFITEGIGDMYYTPPTPAIKPMQFGSVNNQLLDNQVEIIALNRLLLSLAAELHSHLSGERSDVLLKNYNTMLQELKLEVLADIRKNSL